MGKLDSLRPDELREKLSDQAVLSFQIIHGARLVGLLTCFLGAASGFLAAEPVYWLNLISPLSFLAFSAAVFPTRDRLAGVLGRAVGVPMMGSR